MTLFYVKYTAPNGSHQNIGHFDTERQAQAWIETHRRPAETPDQSPFEVIRLTLQSPQEPFSR